MSDVAKVNFTDYPASVTRALDLIGAPARLADARFIILKPNLVNGAAPPVTTPAGLTAAVIDYCRKHTRGEIAIGEGCGSGKTKDTFETNGYANLARRHKLRLIDFNEVEAVKLSRPDALVWKELYLPKIVLDAFLISLPVLKDHSFTQTTIAMKNLIGLVPATYYSGSWNKSKMHTPSTHRSVVDVCLYKRPDLCVVDATTALTGMHLSGTPKKLDLILASFDPVAVDAVGSRLLGHDPRKIEYLTLADGWLGNLAGIRELVS